MARKQIYHPTNILNKRDRMLANHYIKFVTPNLYAAFCLTLYDKYGWEPDQIEECVLETELLWDRSVAEGWNIQQNCAEVCGIEVRHFKDAGRIETKEGDDGKESE